MLWTRPMSELSTQPNNNTSINIIIILLLVLLAVQFISQVKRRWRRRRSETIVLLFSSFDERLRIALGVIAGLLGISAVILFSILCWLHHRQRYAAHLHRQENSDSSTSSLYISPVVRHLSISTVEQELDQSNGKFFRTNSFRQAVLADGPLVEHVSAQRDSVVSSKESCASPNFSTLEFVMPIYQNVPPFTSQPESHRV